MSIKSADAIGKSQPPSAADAVIRAEELHKYYEMGETRVHALRGVSLMISRGEFVAIMGASGSGKSTFMNILECLDRPNSGRYLLEGVDVSQHDKRALASIRNQKIDFVFQGFNLLARTTALENTELPTIYTKIAQADRRKRAIEALALVGLANRAEHFPSALRHEQQPLQLVFLLHGDPPRQQKQLETKLHISERLASVGRLAATVAHEINNPLESVINFIYIAKQHPEASEEIERYLNSADKELRRVAHITQQTLGFYRDNSQPISLVIADVFQDVLTVYERKCQYKALNVERRIEPNLTLNAVQGELKQILSNLIANAIDASKEGGKIVICARTSHHLVSGERGVRITIADNGVGISDENKQNLFTPFFTTKTAVGTGLGLWITKDLLEKKGGRIRFRSTDSGRSGTVMTNYLPSV